MFPSGTWKILVLVFTIGNLKAVSVVDHHPNDEYLLEHEVTYQEAISQARNLKLYPGPVPGCKPCTRQEITYCKDGSVIADHCCCDGSYNEVFPFVEHACRVGPQGCKVQAGDCAEYSRLRDCCCHSYLSAYWKYQAGGSTRMKISITTISTVLLMLRLFR
ncbi:uncharacterized protein LOC117180793 isoform X2 [Belonocnema kinseyi]|uniref:uncharacterized protein LOC117180793 isoform X2 n=1 Tax=Belonocnema kinseyi TaxID=2817044 RepID=UPI00143DF56C|nr:uncharacterized protein LOC117180793 isoform X2 [Belonocnema kinseyi]